jgi:hypothetical protein
MQNADEGALLAGGMLEKITEPRNHLLTRRCELLAAQSKQPNFSFLMKKPIVATLKLTVATLLVGALSLLLVSCESTAPTRGILHEQLHPPADLAVNTEQARLRMRPLVVPFCGELEAVADQLIAGTTNQSIRRDALVWKIEAVPIMRQTLFHANPFVALGDTWVFLWQMSDYFQNGPGKQAFGESAPVAAAACERLEKQLTEVAASCTHSGNVTDIRTFVEKWAADHPIQHSISARESVVGYLTRRRLQETFSAPEVVSDLVVTMDDLSRRMDVYSGQLPEESRWEAELFAMDLARQYQAENAMPLAGRGVQSLANTAGAVDRTVAPLERAANALEAIPETMARERGAAQQDIHEEISRTLQFEEQELKATLTQLTSDVTNERVAALLELHRNIAEERIAFTQDLQRLGFSLVDHAFLRTAQLAAVMALVLFAGVVILLFLTRRLFLTRQTTG